MWKTNFIAMTTTPGNGSPPTTSSGSSSSSGSGSGFSSPGAIAGYAIAGLVIAFITACVGWKQYSLARRHRRNDGQY